MYDDDGPGDLPRSGLHARRRRSAIAALAVGALLAGVLPAALGTRAGSASAAGTDPLLYVAQTTGVTGFDAVTGEQSATLPTSLTPAGSIAFSPDGTTVYAAVGGYPGSGATNTAGELDVIDSATNTITAQIPVGDDPTGVAVSPDGATIYVADFGSAAVSVVSAASDTVIDTIPVDNEPQALSVSPLGTLLYVTEFSTNSVTVIDTIDNAVEATIPVDFSPSAVTFSADSSTAYVANSMGGDVSVINVADFDVTDTIDIDVTSGADALALSPDGGTLYVANQYDQTVSVVDTSTDTVASTITVASQPYSLALTPDGSTLYVAGSGGVDVIDTAAQAVTGSVSSQYSYGAAITPGPQVASVLQNFMQGTAYNPDLAYIDGTGFDDVSAVYFGTYAATFTVTGPGEITADIPAALPYGQTVPVTVLTSLGGSPVNPACEFSRAVVPYDPPGKTPIHRPVI